jgi:hypothetical protein
LGTDLLLLEEMVGEERPHDGAEGDWRRHGED